MIPALSATKIVCLVDDDPTVLTSIGRLLASEGFLTRAFHEPGAFLAHVSESFVPLAIVDVWMEGMTGLEVQARLTKASPGTRVIVMTGRKDPNVEQAAMDSGAVAFFTKPFDDEAFLTAVRRALVSQG